MKVNGMLIIVACAAVMYGCAASVPIELTNARLAYQHASVGPAVQMAPADLHTAQEALATAEKSFSKDSKSYHTRDLAYVAQRKAEMAEVIASIATEQKNKIGSDNAYQVTQGNLLQTKTQDLNQTRAALVVSEQNGQATADQLTAAQIERREADQKAAEQNMQMQAKTEDLNQTRTALAVSQSSGQATADQLTAAQMERRDSDRKAAEQNMQMQAKTEDLNQTRAALTASQNNGQKTAEQLSTEQTARLEAEKKTAEAQAALAKLAGAKEEERGIVITLSGSVLFRSGEATLMSGSQSRLDQVADAILTSPDRNIVVEGYTDSQGSDKYNLDLSQRRADAVRDFLVHRGYDAARIQARGMGEERPIADNATAEGRANNRRVEIVLEREAKP